MAAAPVNPSDFDPAAAAQAAKTWWDFLLPLLSGIFGAGIVWGSGRVTTADHGRRILVLESALGEKLQRLEDKVDRYHNLIVSNLIGVQQD